MEILKFIFQSFWTFLGFAILFAILCKTLIYLVRGFPENGYSEEEAVFIYKLGKTDQKNGHHINDKEIVSEIKAFLKNGSRTSNTKQ